MTVALAERPKIKEQVIRKEEIERVLICNAAGEPIGCVFVPEGGALVVETRVSKESSSYR
jgi:hypothetical protein